MQHVRRQLGTLLLAGTALMMAGTASLSAAPQPKEAHVSFNPDTIVEAAFFQISRENQAELNQRYLSKVLPLAEEFGMNSLGLFAITHVANGPEDASLWGLFQWPDLESRKRFESDARFIELRTIRDELMGSFKIVHLKPKKAFTMTIREGHVYEFAGLWMNRTHASQWDDYLSAARSFGKRNGVSMIETFEVVGTSERYPFLPERVILIDWPDAEAKSKWIDSKAFRSAGWSRALAVDQLYGVESRFVFPR